MVPPTGERMLLVINVGNTNTVIATFHGRTLDRPRRIATDVRRMSDEYIVILDTFFDGPDGGSARIDGAVICSVVPSATEQVVQATRQFFGADPLLVSHTLALGIGVGYSSPDRLGPDRIANAVAAVDLVGAPTIAVDIGTAITLTVVSKDGILLGGAIAPGPAASVRALTQATALLPSVMLEVPGRAIGSDTAACIQSGVIYGAAGLIDVLVSRMREELHSDARVVATGGLVDIVAPHSKTIELVDRHLTLAGMRILYDRSARDDASFRAG